MGIEASVVPNLIRRLPPDQHTASYKIFNYRYLVKISKIHMSTPAFAKAIVNFTSGDPELDESMAREEIEVSLPVADLAELHANGVSFRLCRPEDSVPIYQIIHQHLMDFRAAMVAEVNLYDIPERDLLALDALASDIYRYARHYMREAPTHGRLGSYFQQLRAARGGITRVSPQEQKRKNLNEDGNPLPVEYNSMAKSIMDYSRSRRG